MLIMSENIRTAFQITSSANDTNSHESYHQQNSIIHHTTGNNKVDAQDNNEYDYIDETSILGQNNSYNRTNNNNSEIQQNIISHNSDENVHNTISKNNQYYSNNGIASSIDGIGISKNDCGNVITLNTNVISNNHINNTIKNRNQQQQQIPLSPQPQQQHHPPQSNDCDVDDEDESGIINNKNVLNKTENKENSLSPLWQQPPSIINQQHQQQQQQQQQQPTNNESSMAAITLEIPHNALGVLRNETDILYITENYIEIGRNSSTSSVHFHVAKNSFVSRKHFQITYNPNTCDFFLICLSKNGIFIDDVFQRRSSETVKLPKNCTFRFPSTEIRIAFESFGDKITNDAKNNIKAVENSNVIYSPLKITIPKTEQKSPFPSPTGTISAANSCPTSPRQGFPDYHNYNYNNNNNNNFQNDLFQPPSTSSYNEYEKPPYSYAQLIVQSISASPDKQLTLSGIYSFISKNYPYYRKEANKGWQNSIRHNLSLNRYFIKVARSQDEPGKGSFWRIDPNSEAKLIDQSYKKRRQRGSQCFRPPYGMPRSAPVSPSHIDNSRENSPLHDIVLQSAPGSPGVSYQSNSEHNHTGSDESGNYSSQTLPQQSYNSHNQYKSAIFQTAVFQNSTPSTNLGVLSSHKRHQSAISSGSSGIHPSDIMSDEIHDYSGGGGGVDSDDGGESIKRQKYTLEVNQ